MFYHFCIINTNFIFTIYSDLKKKVCYAKEEDINLEKKYYSYNTGQLNENKTVNNKWKEKMKPESFKIIKIILIICVICINTNKL